MHALNIKTKIKTGQLHIQLLVFFCTRGNYKDHNWEAKRNANQTPVHQRVPWFFSLGKKRGERT